jgi:flagellar biosynthesis protein FlhB
MAQEEDEDDSQKTEEPTQKRLQDAFDRGQGINSREVTNFLLFLVLAIVICWLMPVIMGQSALNLTNFIEHAHVIEVTKGNLGKIIIKAISQNFSLILLPMLLMIVMVVLSSFLQNKGRFILSDEPVKLDLSRISPLKGFARIFSTNNLVEFVKNIVKIIVITIFCMLAIFSEMPKIKTIHEHSLPGMLLLLLKIVGNMLLCICIILAIIAAIDYLYQYYAFMQKMRMSKHEVKEELKQSEGSPEIKSRIRRIRLERAKKRMMSAVPTADVIITNPTHFAVAIKYDELSMNAPVVVAKGQDHLALKMREIAKIHRIPIVENKPLARLLYDETEIDSEISIQHYKAVAEVINYVYKLKR